MNQLSSLYAQPPWSSTKMTNDKGRHSGLVVSTVGSQQEVPGFGTFGCSPRVRVGSLRQVQADVYTPHAQEIAYWTTTKEKTSDAWGKKLHSYFHRHGLILKLQVWKTVVRHLAHIITAHFQDVIARSVFIIIKAKNFKYFWYYRKYSINVAKNSVELLLLRFIPCHIQLKTPVHRTRSCSGACTWGSKGQSIIKDVSEVMLIQGCLHYFSYILHSKKGKKRTKTGGTVWQHQSRDKPSTRTACACCVETS